MTSCVWSKCQKFSSVLDSWTSKGWCSLTSVHNRRWGEAQSKYLNTHRRVCTTHLIEIIPAGAKRVAFSTTKQAERVVLQTLRIIRPAMCTTNTYIWVYYTVAVRDETPHISVPLQLHEMVSFCTLCKHYMGYNGRAIIH